MSLSLREPAAATPVGGGLSSAEAARRLLEFGPNAVAEERVHPALQVLRHFWAPVPWMLEIAIVLQIAIGERLEALMIATLLVVNVALGVFQESRASAALALLRERLSLRARVKRDGVWRDALAAELIPGDVVQLSLGTIVPADLRITTGSLLTRLTALHEAATIDVLCVDKTGTLTANTLAISCVRAFAERCSEDDVLAAGWFLLRLSPGAMRTLTLLTFVMAGQASVYCLRERRPLWQTRPAPVMLFASLADLVVVTSLAIGGVLMTPLAPAIAAALFATTLGFALAFDGVKQTVFARLRVD